MLKRFSSLLLMGFCGTLLTSTILSGQEAAPEKQHIQIGERAESQEVRNANEKARNEKASKAAKAMKNAKALSSGAMHYTTHPGAMHFAVGISMYTGDIEMEDGSLWQIRPIDADLTRSWLSTDRIVITPNHPIFSSYSFKITNQETNQAVLANMHLGPIYNGYYTRWIVGIDYYYYVIYLNDGSRWDMSSLDSSTIYKWLINDTVIIGVNDGFLSSINPNILINVNMLNYAAGVASF